MCKKLIFLVLLLSLAGKALAVDHWFSDEAAGNHLWSTVGNWWQGTCPNSLDNTFINRSGYTCEIDSSVTAVAYQFRVGFNSSSCTLTMSGGTLTAGTGWDCVIGDESAGVGTVNLSGGTWNVNTGGGLWVGDYGNGTLNMTGGTINISTTESGQGLNIPKHTGTGHLDLHGGTINVDGDLFMRAGSGTGTMDVTTGTLVIAGDEESKIEGYVTSGYITAYDGDGTVVVTYAGGDTTVSATAPTPTKATSPNPSDTASDVDVTTDLSWTAGAKTSSHNVYLGTDSSAVTSATTSSSQFKGNQPSTTYDPPGNLTASTTYYWRIDEVNDTYSTTTKGDVWSFTTAVAAASVDHYWDDGAAGDSLWSSADNWDVDTVPTSIDKVFINLASSTCLIDSSVTADANKLRVGYTTATCTLNMTGGILNVGPDWECSIGDQSGSTGVVTMSGGTMNLDNGGGLWVGNYGNGTLTMTAGTINISTSQTNQGLNIPKNTGTGHLDLHGGTINVTNKDFFMRAGGGTGTMDITTGTLVVDGDEESKIEGYVASGWITAYDGDGTVVVTYAGGDTTVSATPPTPAKATNPNPSDTAADVDVTTNLTWTAGAKTSSHDVYLGTDSSAVTAATTSSDEFRGNQPSTTYDPPNDLDANTTYYWRIDEVNDTYSATTEGDVWSFTTASEAAGVTGVQISCSASGYEVTVSYDVNSLLEVRAFALDITVDNGAEITGADNFNSDYWFYPGSIDINAVTEQIDDYGSAICDGNLVGTLPGLNSYGITVEMGSLYHGDANAPADSGTLFKFTVDKACIVTVAENATRRGVVMKGLSDITPDMSGCAVE